MARRRDNEDPGPPEAGASRRQQLVALLEDGERGFEELRRALELSQRALEDDLRHVEKTLKRDKRSLAIAPAACVACGFVFRGRESKHLHPPSRCPRCRSERIDEPRFAIGPAPA